MRLYREKVKAEALAIAAVTPNRTEAARLSGVPMTTLRDWQQAERDRPASDPAVIPMETRIQAKKDVVKTVSDIRDLYLDRAREPDAIAKTSGFYAVLAVEKLTNVHQLLTGGPTSRIEGSLEAVLRAAVGGGKTDPE